jgi:hypothetical protein
MIRRSGLLVLLCAGMLAGTMGHPRAQTSNWTVVPPVAYPTSAQDSAGHSTTTYSFTVLAPQTNRFGNGAYWIYFQGQPPLRACPPGMSATDNRPCDLRISVSEDMAQALFSMVPSKLAGSRRFTLRAEGPTSASGALDITFALMGPGAVRGWALGVVVVLVGIVLLLLRSGRARTLPTGTAVGLLKAAFIDVDTQTYSLSKVQFYVWGFAIIASYVYLTLARSLVQGAAEFASVPDNLAALMGLSVGTTVASVAVSTMAGNKGSGDVGPTPADLITSGGVVAPERLLHLLWTILGGVAFLWFAFSIPPETITSLPAVPNGFLELMGVSAAGYVGGKIARGPGPNIRNITVDPPFRAAAGTAVDPIPLTIEGTNLATEGATFLIAPLSAQGAADPDVPVQVVAEAGSALDAQKIATCIKTHVAAVLPGLNFTVGSQYRFTIINPDGEKSSWNFVVR